MKIEITKKPPYGSGAEIGTTLLEGVSKELDLAILQTALSVQDKKINGLMTAIETTSSDLMLPSSKTQKGLKKAITSTERLIANDQKNTDKQAQIISQTESITYNQALEIANAAYIITNELLSSGLTYREKSFNFALTAPYEIPKNYADFVASISQEVLDATYALAQKDPWVNEILNRGSTPLEKWLWQFQIPYQTTTPINRIDMVDGKIIEWGPNFVDGFGTAKVFADIWGIPNQIPSKISQTFLDLWGMEGKKSNPPSIGIASIKSTREMEPEMEIVAQMLRSQDVLGNVCTGQLEEINQINPDIIFPYFKPSMISGDEDLPILQAQDFIDQYPKSLLIPPLTQQMGKKAIMALIRLYPDYYSQTLGEERYQQLLDVVVDTQIITPDTSYPNQPSVIKPSSGGSNQGIITTSQSGFDTAFIQAQKSFNNTLDDVWVIQPIIQEEIGPTWISQNGGVSKIKNPFCKTTLMVAANEAIGGFAAIDSAFAINDGGYNFPIKLKGGRNE